MRLSESVTATGYLRQLERALPMSVGHDRSVVEPAISFPRQRAVTRSFRLGAPRAFRIVRRRDGSARVFFVRSKDGRTPSGDLWVADQSLHWRERLLVEATFLGVDGEIPAAELARRERLREVTAGITAYSSDRYGEDVSFAVDGVPYRVNVASGDAVELPHPGPVVDPQISPDGIRVAFVSSGRVYWTATDVSEAVCVTPKEPEDVTWGLADFIAAEELERHRGMWWLSDSEHLLLERVDESGVDVRWIGDPARPEAEPTQHRYPSAGTPNAAVSLHRVGIDGSITDLAWNTDRYCYLASVDVPLDRSPVVSVLSRDQQRSQVLEIGNSGNGDLTVRAEYEIEPWITVVAGAPTTTPDGALIDVLDIDDAFRACRNGEPFSPHGWNVDAVLDVDDIGITAQVAIEPETRVIARIDFDGTTSVLTPHSHWSAGAVNGDVTVIASTSAEQARASMTINDSQTSVSISSQAEEPVIAPQPRLFRVGGQELSAAMLLPSMHETGMSWPVICSPYGGPHAQRVIAAGGAYLTEQWLADQGFAVVIIDGRGTPGRGPSWEYAVHHDLAGPVLDDQVDGLLALAEIEPALDLSRVGIRGWSFGGYLAALAVLDRPDVFHAAVAGAPVTEWRFYDTAYTERYLGNPNDDDAPYEATSLLNRAAQLERPLLLIHGLADDNVLAAHTLQMSSALLAAGRQHNVLPLSGVTHMTPQEVVAENLLLTEVEFFRTHLG